MKITTRFMLTMLVFSAVIVLTVFVYFHTTVQNQMIDNALKYSQDEFRQTVGNLEMLVHVFNDANNMICLNEDLSRKVSAYADETPWNQYEIIYQMQSYLTALRTILLFDYSMEYYIYIPGREGPLMSNSQPYTMRYEDIVSADWFSELSFIYSQSRWLTPAEEYFPSLIAGNSLFMISPIWKANALDYCGLLVVEIQESSSFRKLLKGNDSSGESRLYLFNEDDKLISSTDGDNYGQSMEDLKIPYVSLPDKIEGKDIYTSQIGTSQYSYARIYPTGWTLVKGEPYSVIISQANEMKKELIFLLACLTFVAIVLLAVHIRNFVRPIRQMAVIADEMAKGHFGLKMDLKRHDEIGQLANAFDSMSQDVSALLVRLQRESELRNELYMETLRNQLDPHMLLNSLGSIRSLANISGNATIARMITHLSSLLAAALGKDSEFISLQEEIDFCDHFVELQQLRFSQFEYVKHIDPSVLECIVPRMLIQPLIENSIRHGFLNNPIEGQIVLSIYRKDNELHIEEQDNGTGIDQESIDRVFNGDRDGRIGLKNIYDRLVLYYGNDCRETSGPLLQIEALPDNGTRVRICIPCKPKQGYLYKGDG